MPPPYMVQVCQRLLNTEQSSEDNELFTGVCLNWFHQAFEHCSGLLTKKPGCQKLWNRLMTLKRYIFPDSEASLLSNSIQISVHPDELSPANCQEIASQVIKDYLHYVPRYMALLNENNFLWLILRAILGVGLIVFCVCVVARRYNSLPEASPEENPSSPQSLHKWLLVKDIKRVMYETKYLSVVPVMDPQLLQCGCPVLGLKIDAKKFCEIQAILTPTPARLETAGDLDNSEVQACEKLKKFFQNTGKYRLVISLDLDCGDDEGVSKITPVPKTSGIPIHKPSRRIGIRRKL